MEAPAWIRETLSNRMNTVALRSWVKEGMGGTVSADWKVSSLAAGLSGVGVLPGCVGAR